MAALLLWVHPLPDHCPLHLHPVHMYMPWTPAGDGSYQVAVRGVLIPGSPGNCPPPHRTPGGVAPGPALDVSALLSVKPLPSLLLTLSSFLGLEAGQAGTSPACRSSPRAGDRDREREG